MAKHKDAIAAIILNSATLHLRPEGKRQVAHQSSCGRTNCSHDTVVKKRPMNDVYEYRRARGKAVVWLSGMGVVLMLAAVSVTGATDLMWLVWALAALTLALMMVPRPISGIRVDDTYLVLSAWHKPRAVALDDIAFLRAIHGDPETSFVIVYMDGTEEKTLSRDMPDIETMVRVMADRGIAVRGIY